MWGTPRPGRMAGRGGASAGVWCTRLGTRESTVLAGTPLTHHAQDGPGASRQRERVSSSLQQAYLGNRKSSEKHLFLVEDLFVFTTRAAAGRGTPNSVHVLQPR